MESIIKIITQTREDKKLTQNQLSHKAKVPVDSIINLENGNYMKVNFTTFLKIINALDLKVELI